MGFDAFISHSSKDKSVADAACATLESSGVRCWIAPRDIMPGSEYGAAIVDALDHCRVMVLIFSTNANESPQLRREVERAVSRGVPIVPVRIENVAPTKSMAYFVESVHWLDALTLPLENHLHRLAEAVKALLHVDAVGAAAAIKSDPLVVPAASDVTAPSVASKAPHAAAGESPGSAEKPRAAQDEPDRRSDQSRSAGIAELARQSFGAEVPTGGQLRSPDYSLFTKISALGVLLLACAALGIYGYSVWKPRIPVSPSVALIDTPPPSAPKPSTANSGGVKRNQAPVDGGMPVSVGDTYDMISAAYKTYQQPEPSPWDKQHETWLYLKDQGVEFFFDESSKIKGIHFVDPWAGSIRGVKIGDTIDRMKSLLGEPAQADERFGGATVAMVYRWPYTLTVEFHVDKSKNKITIIMLD